MAARACWSLSQQLLLLTSFCAGILAADPTPVTTNKVVVSASPSSVTFTASRVSDFSKYTGLTAPTTITASGTTTIFKDGWIWVPNPATSNAPLVPTPYTPSGVGNTIVVTATTGTSPVVTFTASQNTALTSVTAVTTSSGTVIFPLGWVWVPVPPPGGVLPPVLPPIPVEDVPPEATAEPTQEPTTQKTTGCTTTKTPTATVLISYPTDQYGDYQTSSTTVTASDLGTSCVASTTTTTSKLPASSILVIEVTDDDSPPEETSCPDVYPDLSNAVQQYLDGAFNSLGIGFSSAAPKPTQSCADNTYDKAIPSAAAFIHGLSPSFCSDWGAKPTQSLSKTYKATDVKANSKRDDVVLPRAPLHEKRTPPPAPLTQSSYPGWSIDFTWTPKQVSSTCSTADYCNKVLSDSLTHCEGYSTADAYKGGSSEDSCGKFEWSIKGYPTTSTTCNAVPNPLYTKYLYRDDAIDAINNFCGAHDGMTFKKGDPDVSEQAFTVTYAPNCAGTGSFTLSKSGCISWMTANVDGCDTSSITYKHGGTTVHTETCASLTFHPVGTDVFSCIVPGTNLGGAAGITISSAIAQDVISQFCDRTGDDPKLWTLDPATTFIFGELSACTKDYLPYCTYTYTKDGKRVTDGSKGDIWISIKAFWRPDNANDGLSCSTKQTYLIHGDRCHNQMNKLLGIESGMCKGANADSNALGTFIENGGKGCVKWEAFAIATHS